jgi:predicted transposase YbfD/YdcC
MQPTSHLAAPPVSAAALRPVTPQNLLAAFAAVPDPRRAGSVIYPLPALLALAVAAILSAHDSVLAMAEWAARQSPTLLQQLGFTTSQTPRQSTLQRLFAKLGADAVSAALSAYFVASARPGSRGVALDGKAQRGRLQYQVGGSPVHALSAFCHEQGIVWAQEAIEVSAEKAEAELSVAPTLLARVDWHDRVLTGDALFCQRSLCQQVLAAGGDYLLIVKANQPTLLQDIVDLFEPGPSGQPPLPLNDRREAWTREHGHGRHDECRQLIASTDLNAYLDWPGVAQVFRLERTWRQRGKQHRQVRYGITSLAPAVASAERLLALKRGHWAIENRLHRCKDVALHEDASLVHVGQGPNLLALFRDTALSLLYRAGHRAVAARLRYHAQHPEAAIALLLAPAITDA